MLTNSTKHLILKPAPFPLFLPLILILFTFVNAQEPVETPVLDSNKKETTNNDQKQSIEQQVCGTKETDYTPCMPRERADSIFSHCCSRYVPQGCHSLCQYESDELTARNLVYFFD
uniref:DB domain-containing protein n=1 Tax=Meloidogyne hapla TaxID=6305 RepID=A0A1I8BYB2_MELHA